MRAVLAVFRHELRLLLFSPLTYIFQIGFLLSLSACIFLVAVYYSTDEASIQPMLTFLPWVALILVPALAMRAWVDEPSDRSIEFVLTLPLPMPAVVLGKFLAGYTVLLITLAFTAPLVVTAYYLGAPDTGVVVSGYIGAALLLGLYYALSLFASSLGREQVGAFVIGVVLLFVLLLLGWDAFGQLLRNWLPAGAIEVLTFYSPKTWLDSIGEGNIEFVGVFYFLVSILAALLANVWVINGRRYGTWSVPRTLKGLAAALTLVGLLAVIIPASSRIPLALDLTSEGEFSLHAGTMRVLQSLPSDVEATFYWSATEASVPTTVKSHARRIQGLLATLAKKSQGKLTVHAMNPEPDSEEELAAIRHGLRRVPMSSGDHFYLGATFQHAGRIGSIPYFDIRRDRLSEYDIAVALNGLARSRTPKIGIISPFLPPAAAVENQEGLSFMTELRRAYDIAVIPYFKDELPVDLDVLVLIDTPILRQRMLYAIDQFLMKGGRLIVMLDPLVRFGKAANAVTPEPSQEINDISDLLLAYGMRYEGKKVVGDTALAAPVTDQRQVTMSYPYWMRVGGENLSASHPVTAALNELFFVEPGELIVSDKDHALPIVTTTDKSGAIAREEFSVKTPRELTLEFQSDGRRRVIAATARGPFSSAFTTPPAGIDPRSHVSRSSKDALLFAVADIDWLFDPFALQTIDVGGQAMVRPLNDNLSFLLNVLEYASGDPALISIRSRGQLQHPFTRVQRLFKDAEQKYRQEEAKLVRQVDAVEQRIAALMQQAGVNSLEQLPPALKDQARRFQLELLPMRKQLRDIRRRIREQVEELGRQLTVINMLAGPLMVLLFASAMFFFRSRRR
jgi:ABC-2 type transport system permease protein